MQIAKQLFRNVSASWFGYTAHLVIAFLFVPFIAGTLGEARYGVWAIVFQAIGYFSLLDLGFEKALLRFVSRYLAQRDFARINQVLQSSLRVYLVTGTLIILGVWITATYLFPLLNIESAEHLKEGQQALIIAGIYLGIRFFLLPYGGSLNAFQRFDWNRMLGVTEEIVRTLAMVWLLYNDYGLPALALALLGTSLLFQILSIVVLKRLHPEIQFGTSGWNKSTALEMFSYSRTTLGISLGWLVVFGSDVILLGYLASASAAGVYQPGAQLILMMRVAIHSVSAPFTTAVSHLESENRMTQVRELYLKGIKYASFMSFGFAVGVILYARPFVALWLPEGFGGSADVMRILAISAAFFLPQILANAILFGIDKHSIILKVLSIEAALKIALSLILIGPYGIVGMAYATMIPQLLLYTTLYPWLVSRALEVSVMWSMLQSLRSGLLALMVAVPLAIAGKLLLPPESWGTLVANVVLIVVPLAAVGWLLIVAKEDRRRVIGWLTGRS